MKWLRVNARNRCCICKKPDWCTYADDGSGACCMRIQSAKPMHNGGWWHPSGSKSVVPVKHEEPAPTINATKLIREWQAATDPGWIDGFAKELGVASAALDAIGCCWASEYKAFAFPMKDAYGNVIGIRLRDQQGRKWAVKGSRAGLFYGHVFKDGLLCVAEGPTDAAAGLTIDLNTIGRPSCVGQEDFLLTMARHSRRVLIISDNDSPGWQGAQKLQAMLKVPSLIWAPPTKDLREFVNRGGTQQLVECMTKSLCWTMPKEAYVPSI